MSIASEDLRKMLDEATEGPWVMETVSTSCGVCHKIGPFPPRSWSHASASHACIYDDYPSPATGTDTLISNARLIALAPTLAAEVLRLREALEPFARLLDAAELMGGPSRLTKDDDPLMDITAGKVGQRRITLGDLKRARTTLEAGQ